MAEFPVAPAAQQLRARGGERDVRTGARLARGIAHGLEGAARHLTFLTDPTAGYHRIASLKS
jgi:hypothetical protein